MNPGATEPPNSAAVSSLLNERPVAPRYNSKFANWWGTLTPVYRWVLILFTITCFAGVIIGIVFAVLGAATGQLQPAGPVVINTWWADVTQVAYNYANQSYSALDVVELGCSYAEAQQKDGTVGWGGSPDSTGETTLDAIIIDGVTHDAGAVAYLRRVKHAISAARRVLHYSSETLLAGEGATNFSVMMGLPEEDLHSNNSINSYNQWVNKSCQPNYWLNVANQNTSCPPYVPIPTPTYAPVSSSAQAEAGKRRMEVAEGDGFAAHTLAMRSASSRGQPLPVSMPRKPRAANAFISPTNHDTVGMCVLDMQGNLAAGGSSNGANHKIAGRVGDVPIIGAAAYVDNDVGCAAATGDGDLTQRFLPAYQAVEFMRQGLDPLSACTEAIRRIERYYSTFAIGLVCLDKYGNTAAQSHGWTFTYGYAGPQTGGVAQSVQVPAMDN